MKIGTWFYIAGTIMCCIGLVRGASMSGVGVSLVLLGGTMLSMVFIGD
jgi:hypothetical protein